MLSFIFSKWASIVVGTLYPGYASFKAIQSKEEDDDKQWLSYWITLSLITTFELTADFIVAWIPLFYEFKLVLLLWMLSPQTKGALFLYNNYVDPFFTKNEAKFDKLEAKMEKVLDSKAATRLATVVDQKVEDKFQENTFSKPPVSNPAAAPAGISPATAAAVAAAVPTFTSGALPSFAPTSPLEVKKVA